ncbi:peptidase M23 [Tamlana sedimentorum]|uniref:Peptidase M23 n=1 Tax=Neotamlana sedimentorum TaxID=1435349 RepID=A0A0D7W061_9FLAO|nr:peptidoglycan DD-metalloendopeptidase family protein [Tamlana sedimentorum]KJD32414.1 peptidase M23 [Tamlana sedimentorum]
MDFNSFSKFIKSLANDAFPVLGDSFSKDDFVTINLSETNTFLNSVDVSSSAKLSEFVSNHIQNQNGKVAYGGYLEVRNIYKRSKHFNSQALTERNIHIGLDLWCDAETSIFSPLNGEVHSFKNNTNFGDYGPTIILKHCYKSEVFYTLYGHLSLQSIANLKVGMPVVKGELMAVLGDASVNGDYPPHLHFQIIKDIQGCVGDYPGVSSKADVEFYKSNCPDPKLLFGL